METKRWGEPNFELYGKPLSDVHNVTSLDVDNREPNQRRFPTVFVQKTVKQYKKIEGKRYRLPRKVKKRYKSKMCKAVGFKGTKKLKFSYKRLNMIHNNHEIQRMEHKVFILKQNTPEIRERIRQAGIDVCFCADFVDADWLDYHTSVANGVHGNGYPYEGMTKEETRAMFMQESQNPVYCKDVDEFIKLIKEFEDGNKAK